MSIRPLMHLQKASKEYPLTWKLADMFRADRGQDGFTTWPDWCFLPMAGYQAIATEGPDGSISNYLNATTARLSALGIWRVTQGVYRFNEDLEQALLDSPVSGDIPVDVLYRLPEWCIYIETTKLVFLNEKVYGFFAHLEWDANTERTELRLMLDTEEDLMPIILYIGPWSIQESINKMVAEIKNKCSSFLRDIEIKLDDPYDNNAVNSIMSLILYVCSDTSEYVKSSPQRPKGKKTKKGLRFYPPDKPKIITVGDKLGEALREHKQKQSIENNTSGSTKRAHIRRGHWHGFWTGKRSEKQNFNHRWLPPKSINFNLESMGKE